jgi:hypothetical protein
MSDLPNFWNMPADDQQEHVNMQTPGQLPAQCTLQNALNTGEYGCELAACATLLFIIVVQDRSGLDNGYGVQVTALGQIFTKHFDFDELEEVETWLETYAPYTKHTPVWVPLPMYDSNKHETEYLNKLWP